MSMNYILSIIPTENEELVLYHLDRYIQNYKNVNYCCNCLFVESDSYGSNTLLHMATMFNMFEVINMGLDNLEILDIDINQKNNVEMSVLHYACSSLINNYETIKKLIEYGADVNSKNYYGYTPLHYACVNKNVQIAILLINSGADLFVEYKYSNKTLLHDACENNLELIASIIFKKMLKYKKKILFKTDKNGDNYIHLFSMKKMENLAIKMIDELINYSETNNFLCFIKNEKINIKKFISSPNSHNRTALFYATINKLNKLALKIINEIGFCDYSQDTNIKITDEVKFNLVSEFENKLKMNNILIDKNLISNIYNLIY